MNTKKENFKWDKLLKRIKEEKIIPIIGQGLYLVKKEGKGEILLYDYLADKLAEKFKTKPPPEIRHKFSMAAFEYLKENKSDDEGLNDFLKDMVKEEKLIASNPLLKLARIKAFRFFINTTYDDFLLKAIKTVRIYPTKVLNYTKVEKRDAILGWEDYRALKESNCTFVYNIFGNFTKNARPAFTEKDILETIVDFQMDMQTNSENNLQYVLKENSLLFMGCHYEDWLCRFFIRAIANEEYEDKKSSHKFKFVCDDLVNNIKDPFHELPRFLEHYQSEVYCGGGKDSVDLLFEKLAEKYPEEIIQETDFPATAFISFIGKDRPAADKLASNLREDGISVWLDDREFDPGDNVDEKIIKAIKKCHVFIPLVSRKSKKIKAKGKLKYHVREWEWAYYRHIDEKRPMTIMPVIIDATKWMYEKFKELYSVKVPSGDRRGDYEKLKNWLLEFQLQT